MSARQLITEHLDLWTGAVTKKFSSGRGSNGKVELTGIKKLRELILELAVRGKLVNQNSNDECASVLLEKISQEKATLAKQGKIKKPQKLTAITEEDIPFDLPNGWQWARVWEISELITSGSRDWAKYYSESGAIFITMGNLSRGDYKLRLDNIRYVSPPTGGEGARTSLQGGDLVVSITGDVGNLGLIPEGFGEAYINQHSCLVRISSLCRNRYHAEFLRSPCAKSQFDEPQRGVKNSFRLSDMGEMLIPVPPLEEQHRIVQKVDELMALCDRLEQQTGDQLEAHETLVDTLLSTLTQSANATELADNWARLAAHFDTLFTTEQSIDKLKQTILQLAVMGRLVEQDAEDEPASDLIQRINQERLKLEGEGKVRAVKKTARAGVVEPLPGKWAKCSLGTCISLISGQHLKGDEYFDDKRPESVPYLTGPAEFGARTPEPQRYTFERRAVAEKGDILITCKGSGVGKLNTASEEIAISRQLMAARPILINARFLYLLLDSLRDAIREKTVGIAIPGISRGDILDANIQLPPLEEQHRIVQKVDELMVLCDQLKERLNQARETRCQLAEAVVDNAVN